MVTPSSVRRTGVSSVVTQHKRETSSVCQVCHTHTAMHTPALLESWEGSKQPGPLSCLSKPGEGRTTSLALPCPCQLGKPQQHQSLCRAGHWTHLHPVQAANRDSCLPSKLPAALRHNQQALGNGFALCTYGPAPSLLCPCPQKVSHSFLSQHLQVLRKEPTKQCSNGTVTARLDQEGLCKIMPFSCKMHHFLQEM